MRSPRSGVHLVLTVLAMLGATASASDAQLHPQIPRPFGSFIATKGSDPVDATSTAAAFSTATVQDERGAAIAWRCMGDGLNIVYLVGHPFDGVTDIDVSSRVDDDQPSTSVRWTLLQGHRALFLPAAQVLAFTQRALTGRTLVMLATDPAESRTYTDEFSLAGLAAALDYILPCGGPA